MYGRISDPEMGTYPPLVRRDLGVARGATLAARWLHDPQPTSNHPVGLGFLHPAGRYRSGAVRFRPRVVGYVDVWKVF